jgi:hypothetical protein
LRACRASDWRDAAERRSRLSARVTARDLRGDGRFFPRRPARESVAALCRVRRVLPFPGTGSLTPERRAFDNPIAIACFVDRAPCLPSRMWCISSRTNSPACVDGALPARLSRRARSTVAFSGILSSTVDQRNLSATKRMLSRAVCVGLTPRVIGNRQPSAPARSWFTGRRLRLFASI